MRKRRSRHFVYKSRSNQLIRKHMFTIPRGLIFKPNENPSGPLHDVATNLYNCKLKTCREPMMTRSVEGTARPRSGQSSTAPFVEDAISKKLEGPVVIPRTVHANRDGSQKPCLFLTGLSRPRSSLRCVFICLRYFCS